MTDVEPEEDEVEELSVPPPEPSSGGSGGRTIAIALAAVFGLTAVLLAFVAVSYKADLDEAQTDQQDLELAASRFAQAFVDRDADLASLEDDVVPLSTDPFLEEFEDGVDEIYALSESLGHQSTRATIQEVYTTSTTGDTARAIVVYDAVATFADGRTVTNENQHLRLGMVRTDGEWKVNNVVDLLTSLADTAQPPSG